MWTPPSLRPPCIHLIHDKCSQAFPVFHSSSTSIYYTRRKLKNKNGRGLETRPTWHMTLSWGPVPIVSICTKGHLIRFTHFQIRNALPTLVSAPCWSGIPDLQLCHRTPHPQSRPPVSFGSGLASFQAMLTWERG